MVVRLGTADGTRRRGRRSTTNCQKVGRRRRLADLSPGLRLHAGTWRERPDCGPGCAGRSRSLDGLQEADCCWAVFHSRDTFHSLPRRPGPCRTDTVS